MQRLLSDLARRGPSAYQEFMDCLSDTEQQHIVDKLRTTEDTLRKREPKYLTPTMNVSYVFEFDVYTTTADGVEKT